MGRLVMKFGGTSVGNPSAIELASGIVLEQARAWGEVVCVVSAMAGVTDLLLKGVRSAAAGDRETFQQIAITLRERHGAVVAELIKAEREVISAEIDRLVIDFEMLCQSVAVLGEATPRVIDAVSSLGERMSARLVAAVIRAAGGRAKALDASELIRTDGRFGDAAPLLEETREQTRSHLLPLLEEGIIPIVTGFIGATREGVITTLGRGGSDYSAAILGAALDADEVWIYTDVDGVMTADPRLVSDARVIPILSYAEVGELAYFGAKVLHPRTIRPLIEKNIPLCTRNTFNPGHPGTLITGRAEPAPGTIKAVTAVRGLSLLTVEGRGMVGVPGIAARTFAAVAGVGANVLMISQASSEQSICFVVPADSAPAVVMALEEALDAELRRRDIDRIWAQDGVVIVSAVGAGMRGTPGVASRVFSVLGEQGINIIAIAQGSSECSISLVVSTDDTDAAVRSIHSLTYNGEHRALRAPCS